MTRDAEFIEAAAQLGWDGVLPDPTDHEIVSCVEEIVDDFVDPTTWQGDRLRRGILSAWERGRLQSEAVENDPTTWAVESDDAIAGIVRSTCSTFGLS